MPLLLVAAVTFGYVGCDNAASDETTPDAMPQITGAWYLVEGTVDGEPIEPDPLRRVTLVTDPQGTGEARELAGFSGCNWYGVGLEYDADTLHVGTPTSTAMGCGGDPGRVERLYRAALADVDQADQKADTLTLTGSKSALHFAPIPPIEMDGVVGRRWVLDSIVDGEVGSPEVDSRPAKGDAWLDLTATGEATGSTGCGRFTDDWTLFLGEVRFTGGPMSGMETCPASLNDQHGDVIGVLSIFTPIVDGDRLLVQGQSGSGLIYRLAGT